LIPRCAARSRRDAGGRFGADAGDQFVEQSPQHVGFART
jgi:hypothetical protein